MIQKPARYSFDSTKGPSVNTASSPRPSMTVAVLGGPEAAGEDPVAVGLELVVEDIDRGHLLGGGGVGRVVQDGEQVLRHQSHLLSSCGRPQRAAFTSTTNGAASIGHGGLPQIARDCSVKRFYSARHSAPQHIEGFPGRVPPRSRATVGA